jgi:hypothetical protein
LDRKSDIIYGANMADDGAQKTFADGEKLAQVLDFEQRFIAWIIGGYAVGLVGQGWCIRHDLLWMI